MVPQADSRVNVETLSGWVSDHYHDARHRADKARADIQSPTTLPHNVGADGSVERYHFADAESVVWRKVGQIVDDASLTPDQVVAKTWRYCADVLYDLGRNKPNLGPRPVSDAAEMIRDSAMVKAIALVMNEILSEIEEGQGTCGDL